MNDKLSSRFNVIDNEDSFKPEESFEAVEEIPDILLKDELLEKVEAIPVWFEYSYEKRKEMITAFVDSKAADIPDKDELTEKLLKISCGYGVLQNLALNKNVDTIFINGTKSVYAEISGKISNSGIKLSQKEFNFIKNSVMSGTDEFFASFVSPECIVLRRRRDFDLNSLVEKGFISNEIFAFLVNELKNGKNIVISAPSYSGKTMLAGAVLSKLSDKRIVLIENTPKISHDFDGLIKLVTDNDLKSADDTLNLSPDYVVCDLNKVLLFDRKGVLMTLNAVSAEDVLKKFINAYIQNGYTEKIAKNEVLNYIDYIVHINKSECKADTVYEVTPSKTSAAALKIVSDFS